VPQQISIRKIRRLKIISRFTISNGKVGWCTIFHLFSSLGSSNHPTIDDDLVKLATSRNPSENRSPFAEGFFAQALHAFLSSLVLVHILGIATVRSYFVCTPVVRSQTRKSSRLFLRTAETASKTSQLLLLYTTICPTCTCMYVVPVRRLANYKAVLACADQADGSPLHCVYGI